MSEQATTEQPQTGTQPEKEHEWLQQLVGEWTSECTCAMGPDQPRETTTGTESVRSIGGLWVVLEGRGEMWDTSEVASIMSLGFDLTARKYVGTFICSMMSKLWVYDITMAPEGNALLMDSEGPDMMDPEKTAKYRDVVEIHAPDHRTLTSYIHASDGQWQEFLTTHYRRVQ